MADFLSMSTTISDSGSFYRNSSAVNTSLKYPLRTLITIEQIHDEAAATSASVKFATMAMSIVILVVGVVGNSINILVFGKREMRKVSTFRFLLFLSIFDMLVLLVCSTDAFIQFGFAYEIRLLSDFMCRTHTFLTYFLPQCSSNVLMAVSIDRALVMFRGSHGLRPLQSTSRTDGRHAARRNTNFLIAKLNKRFHRVDMIMFILVLFIFLINSHYFIFMNLSLREQTGDGMTSSSEPIFLPAANSTTYSIAPLLVFYEYSEPIAMGSPYVCFPIYNPVYIEFLSQVWIWIDACLCFFIPFLVMSVCSTLIFVRITRKTSKLFNHLNTSNASNRAVYIRRAKRNRQLLYMLLLTNCYFLLSCLPYLVTFVMFRGERTMSEFAKSIVHLILYTNNTVNFVFYGWSCEKYRTEFVKLFYRRNNRNVSMHMMNV